MVEFKVGDTVQPLPGALYEGTPGVVVRSTVGWATVHFDDGYEMAYAAERLSLIAEQVATTPVISAEPTISVPQGITLRDWFAGMALQGAVAEGALVRINKGVIEAPESAELSDEGLADCTNYLVARMMYQLADAMLAQREATKGEVSK